MKRLCFRIFELLLLLNLAMAQDDDYDWVGPCRLVFSEIKLATGENSEQRTQYLELQVACKSKPRQSTQHKLSNFFVIFVEGETEEIVMRCQLKGETTASGPWKTEKHFFVIGSQNMENKHMAITECASTLQNKDRFPVGYYNPIGVALLKADNGRAKSLLARLQLGKRLDSENINFFHSKIRDFITYYTKSPQRRCPIFEKFYSHDQTNFRRPLRYLQGGFAADYSLNRCTEDDSAFPEVLLLSVPTPAKENDCLHGFKLQLENLPNIFIAGVIIIKTYYTVLNNHDNNCLNIDFNPLVMTSITQPQIVAALEAARTSAAVPVVTPSTNTTESPNPRPPKKVWDDCSPFPAAYIDHISQFLWSLIKIDDVLQPDRCYWFEYKINPENPEKSQAYCKLCKYNRDNKIIKERPGSPLWDMCTSNVGCLINHRWNKNIRKENNEALDHHSENPVHLVSVQIARCEDDGKQGEELRTCKKQEGGAFRSLYQPTQRFFEIIRFASKTKMTFNSFPELKKLMDILKVDVGQNYYNPAGYRRAVLFASQWLHERNLKELIKSESKVSLTFDESTGRSGISTLVVIIRGVDQQLQLFEMFYMFIELEGTSGSDIFKKFQQQITNDGLLEFLQHHMVGFGSDGSGNIKEVFRGNLSTWLNTDINEDERNNFFPCWCAAHRVELVIKHALEPWDMAGEVDSTIQNSYNLFRTKQPKAKQELTTTAVVLHVRPFGITKPYKIRFVASKKKSAATILKKWNVIMKTLQAIFGNIRKYTKEFRQRAKQLFDNLRSGRFLLHLAWFADVYEAFSVASLKFQEKTISVVDLTKTLSELKSAIQDLEHNNGEHLTNLLANSKCKDKDACDIEDLDEREGLVTLFDIDIIHDVEQDGFNFSRGFYVGALMRQLDIYFGPSTQQVFQIFSPSFLEKFISNDAIEVVDPKTMDQIVQMPGDQYAKEALGRICRWFGWTGNCADIATLFLEYKTLVQLIIALPEYDYLKSKDAPTFWNLVFGMDNPVIHFAFSPRMVMMLQTVLAVAAVTSSNERYFSLYNRVHTAQTYSLSPATVNALVGITTADSFPGVTLDTLDLAEAWAESHARTDDSQFIPNPIQVPEDWFVDLDDATENSDDLHIIMSEDDEESIFEPDPDDISNPAT